MNKLPTKALLFILAVYCFASAATATVVLLPLPKTPGPAWAVLAFLALAALLSHHTITFSSRRKNTVPVRVSIGFVVTFAALLCNGPGAGMLAGIVGCVAGALRGRKQAPYQFLFNIALSTVETFFAGSVFLAAHGAELIVHPLTAVPAIAFAAGTYSLVNTVSVAAVIGLCTGQGVVKLWRRSFVPTTPSYFAGASLSALAILASAGNMFFVAALACGGVYLASKGYAASRRRASERDLSDPVTRLYSYDHFAPVVNDLCQSGTTAERFAVISVTFEGFGSVSDDLGTEAADRIIRELSDVLRFCVQAEDIPARRGGEEFLVAVPSAGGEEAASIVRKFQDALEVYNSLRARSRINSPRIIASAGWSVYPVDGSDCAALAASAADAGKRNKAASEQGTDTYLPRAA